MCVHSIGLNTCKLHFFSARQHLWKFESNNQKVFLTKPVFFSNGMYGIRLAYVRSCLKTIDFVFSVDYCKNFMMMLRVVYCWNRLKNFDKGFLRHFGGTYFFFRKMSLSQYLTICVMWKLKGSHPSIQTSAHWHVSEFYTMTTLIFHFLRRFLSHSNRRHMACVCNASLGTVIYCIHYIFFRYCAVA